MPTLDPWDDALELARRLQAPDAELLVVIGAQAWCDKCKRLKPAFEALCAQAMGDHVLWLWLDLEDHADFLGGFIPPDLPLLLRWRQGVCVQAAIVEDIQPDRLPADRVRLKPLAVDGSALIAGPDGQDIATLPQLWAMFSASGWAQG